MSIPIVLLHGALGSASQLEPLKNKFHATGRAVYPINFSGHSGKPNADNGFGINVFADDVIRFLDQEKIETTDIFGYSMGGYVALWLAHQHPLRVNRIITFGTKFDWSPETAAREIEKMDPEKIQEKVPAFARLLEHQHAPNDWRELLLQTGAMMNSLGKQPLLTEEIFSTIQHTTTILPGDQDDMADRNYSEKIAQLLPNGTFHLMEIIK